MENKTEDANFRVVDFIVFLCLLVVSVAVGSFFAYRDRKRQSVENYYFGGRKISPIPVAISIAVSFVSAITVIGIPAEVYLYGDSFSWFPISFIVPTIFGIVYYVPLVHRLRISSAYEYLELRYHRNVRIAASVLGILNLIAYLAIAVLLPSLALSAVTPLNITWTIALTSMTCTLYTTLGGMKAVIWADVVQSFIMAIGMAAVFVRTLLAVGGFSSVLSAARRGDRNNINTFNFDPRVRSSAISYFVGGSVGLSYEILCSQVYVQRWLSCNTIESARIAILLSVIPVALFCFLAIGNGLAMYAYYEGCDPLSSGKISKADQLIPHLAVEIFYSTPGLAGLFVSAALSGTLSTVSSGLNAMSALGLMDLVTIFFPSLGTRTRLLISKGLCVIFGVIIMLLAYAMSLNETNVVGIVNMMFGFFAGPFLGIFTMGIMMPWINNKGAVVGFVCGFAINAWIGIGSAFSTFVPKGSQKLPLSVSNCTSQENENYTSLTTESYATTDNPGFNTTSSNPNYDFSASLDSTIYALSSFMYGPVGLLACVAGAHIACLFSGFSKPSQAEPRLFLPLIDNEHLPYRVRKFFRFGVPELADLESDQTVQYTEGSERGKIDL